MTEEDFIDRSCDPVWEGPADQARWGYRQDIVVKDDHGYHWIASVYITTGDNGGIEVEDGPHIAEPKTVTVTTWAKKAD